MEYQYLKNRKALNVKNYTKLMHELKHRITIAEYLLDHVYPKKVERTLDIDKLQSMRYNASSEVFILCPFHEETKPSFRIFPTKNEYFCFGSCRRGGSIIELHAHAIEDSTGRKLEKPEVVLSLARLYSIQHLPIYEEDIKLNSISSSVSYDDIMKESKFELNPTLTLPVLKSQAKQISQRGNACDWDWKLIAELDYLYSLGLPEPELFKELQLLIYPNVQPVTHNEVITTYETETVYDLSPPEQIEQLDNLTETELLDLKQNAIKELEKQNFKRIDQAFEDLINQNS